MEATQTRTLAFLLGCMGIRSLFVLGAMKVPTKVVQWSALPALLLALGWILMYRNKWRQQGVEAGGPIWWTELRPVHASLYAAFATLAVTRTDLAYIPLLIDVVIGFVAFLTHHGYVSF